MLLSITSAGFPFGWFNREVVPDATAPEIAPIWAAFKTFPPEIPAVNAPVPAPIAVSVSILLISFFRAV